MLRSLCVALLIMLSAAPATADEWPTGQVTIVSPFPVAGTADLIARLVAEILERRLQQSVIVEERAGNSGLVGTASVAKAKPDGYTLMVGTVSTHAISPSFEDNPPYDAEKDFIPVAFLARVPNVLVINPKLPVNTVSELIAYIKANPNAGTFGSAGNGTSQHVGGVLFGLKAGVKMTHVAMKSGNEIMNGIATGAVQMSFNNSLWAWPLARAGKVRAIGVTTARPSPSLPGIPAIAETVPGFEATAWYGLFAPAGTPRHVVDKLSEEITGMLREPFVAKQLSVLGAEVEIMTPLEFTSFCSIERMKWREVVKAIKAKTN